MIQNLGLEAKKAAAKTVFVRAAIDALSEKALRELYSLQADDKVARWAKTHHLNAGCVIERAIELRAKRTSDEPGENWRTSRNFPLEVPGAWLSELARLDRLALAGRIGLRVANSHVRKYLSYLEQNPARPSRHDDTLAPLSADPLTETVGHFLDRARVHYVARELRLKTVARAESFSPSVLRRSPELHKHVEWLLRFQLRAESYVEVAKGAGLRGPGQAATVGKAVRDVAGLVGLSLRPVRVGRPTRK